ncbi:MAG: DUF4030 domain-containing protein [Bacilli bacterium]|nr:DUF4030 domain-containing protein [Bacilli bacterium]
MKKSLIGIVIVICVVIGASWFVNNSSDKTVVTTVNPDTEKINRELVFLMQSLQDGLKDNKEFVYVRTEYQKAITIETAINSSDKNAKELAKGIEKSVNEILKSKELNSVSKIESYKIIVENSDGQTVN